MDLEQHDDVIRANIELHTALADKYNSDEPHFRPENVAKVKSKLFELKSKCRANTLLDIGCGTGFIINIAIDLGFESVVGYDITPAMIDQVQKCNSKVKTVITDVTKPFPSADSQFDMITAYTFLSHLKDMQITFNEAFRVLKPGGVFYSDLDPNYYFWQAMDQIDLEKTYHPYVQREVLNTKNNDKLLQSKYGISPETYNTAEHQKTKTGGMKEESLREMLTQAGFKKVEFSYEWFVGQAVINNDATRSKEVRDELMNQIDRYLQNALPLTRSLYKYLAFQAYK